MKAGTFLAARLLKLNRQLLETFCKQGSHPEALHDLRVVLRKLRVVLPLSQRFWGRNVLKLRKGLTRIHRAAGAARDQEVVRALLKNAPEPLDGLFAEAEQDLSVFSSKIEKISIKLEKLLTRTPKRECRLKPFAKRKVQKEQRQLQKLLYDADPAGLHRLRLQAKKLRYTVEFFKDHLPEKLALLEPAARAIQEQLGQLHDLQLALSLVSTAQTLPEASRQHTLRWLQQEYSARLTLIHRFGST
jgi:CHAD domain-containing protein